MVVSLRLLDLPDEALRLIILALCHDVLRDHRDEDGLARPHRRRGPTFCNFKPIDAPPAPNLSSCSRRLNYLYRTSIRTLDLRAIYSASECERLLDRFPNVVSLDLHWQPCGQWAWLVRTGIKSVRINRCGMHVRELQEILKKITGLEELELRNCDVGLDHELAYYTDEMCTVALERHAGSLKKLVLSDTALQTALIPTPWLQLVTFAEHGFAGAVGIRSYSAVWICDFRADPTSKP